MKKLINLAALSLTAGMLLSACADPEEVDEDFPGMEEPADDGMDDGMNDGLDDGMDGDTDTDG